MRNRETTLKIFATLIVSAAAAATIAHAEPQAPAVSDETKSAAQALAAKFAGEAQPESPAAAQPAANSENAAPVTTGSINDAEAPPMMSALSQSARTAGEHAFDYETFARQEEEAAEPATPRASAATKKKVVKRKAAAAKSAGVSNDAYRQQRRKLPPLAKPAPKEEEPSTLAKIFNPSNWSWPGGDDASVPSEPAPEAPATALTDSEPTAADTTRSALAP